MFEKCRTTLSLQDYQTCWWTHTGKEGLCFNWRLCLLVGTILRHHLKALPRLRRNLSLLRHNRLLHGTLSGTHKGHQISTLIVEEHWIRKWWPFATLMTLSFIKSWWNCSILLKRKLENWEPQTAGFTLQPPGFDFIMYPEEHCMSQTKLKFHMINLDRIDWPCSTLLALTKTESHLWINGTLTKVETLDSFGLDWLCFRLQIASLTLLWNKKYMTEQQETPRHCHRSKEPTEQQRASTQSYTLTILFMVWALCESLKVVKNNPNHQTDRQPAIQIGYCLVDTGPDVGKRTSSWLLWIFRLDLLLLFWSHTKVDITYSVAELKKFIYETGRTYGILQYDKKPALKALVTDVCKRIEEAWVFEQHLRTGSRAHESTGKIHQTLFEQSRTLRLQLQRTDFALRLTRTTVHLSVDCETFTVLTESFSWLMKMVTLLTLEDGKETIKEPLCEFGETVLFRMPGRIWGMKTDTAWHTLEYG